MNATGHKPYEEKAVTRAQAMNYRFFGWVRTNDKIPADNRKKGKNAPEVVIKRHIEFGADPRIASYENEYRKLEKKKYRRLPILGILCFLLMLIFIAVSGIELYYGITKALDSVKAANASNVNSRILAAEESAETTDAASPETSSAFDTVKTKILDVLNTVKTNYISKATVYLDGKTDEQTGEYTQGIVDKIDSAVGKPVATYLNVDMFAGVVSLILGILFLIFFCSIVKIPKKRAKKEYKMADCQAKAKDAVDKMRRSDLSLMSRDERKQYMWETIISNAIKSANAVEQSDDDGNY
jgi:cell division protein FtsB